MTVKVETFVFTHKYVRVLRRCRVVKEKNVLWIGPRHLFSVTIRPRILFKIYPRLLQPYTEGQISVSGWLWRPQYVSSHISMSLLRTILKCFHLIVRLIFLIWVMKNYFRLLLRNIKRKETERTGGNIE